MFGISFGEMMVLAVVALVVVGPRRLPSMLRTAGQIIGRVRRMAMDIRAESGIDEILDAEGIRSELDNFRRMAAGEIPFEDEKVRPVVPDREREYPRVGSDAYGSLSEDLIPYVPAAASPAITGAPTSALPAAATPALPAAAIAAALVAETVSAPSAPLPASPAPAPATAAAPNAAFPSRVGSNGGPAEPPPRPEPTGTVANTGIAETEAPSLDVKN